MAPAERLDRIEAALDRMAQQQAENSREMDERSKEIRETISRTSENINRNTEDIKRNTESIKMLFDALIRTDMAVNRVIDSQAALVASQKKTDETLQAFIPSLQKGGNGSR
jgi:hypothetical protein